VKPLAVAVWVALLLAIPSVAAACPNCVGSSNRNTTILKLVGAFMLVPFIVFYAIVRVIRRAQRETQQIDSPK
jgi:uncharacterized membrane protein YadS